MREHLPLRQCPSEEQQQEFEEALEELRAEVSWPEYTENVVTFLTSHFPDRWEEKEIERAAGVLRTNAYGVEAGQPEDYGMVRIIYPLLSVM